MTSQTTTVLAGLRSTAAGIDELKAPRASGVYAIFLAAGAALPGFAATAEPIYVGTSGNLAERDFDTHFNSTQTGFSTVRRSLGAILKQELGLEARPRGEGRSGQDYYCYRFEETHETRLTAWMTTNLRIAAFPVDVADAVERALISETRPPLNLTGWDNPDRAEIKRLRKVCADEARTKGQ